MKKGDIQVDLKVNLGMYFNDPWERVWKRFRSW